LKALSKQTRGIFVSGLILSLIGFGIFWDRQHRAWFDELEQEVLEDSLILTGELEVVKRELLGVISLYSSSEYVTREEFGVYVRPLLENHPFIQAFEWVPLVNHAEKEGFESITRSMGYPKFKVFGSQQPKQEYLPVHYSEPLSENEQTLGFDLQGDKQLFEVTNKARDTGKTVAISNYGDVPNARSKSDLIIFAPFYDGGKNYSRPEERREYLKGFVLGIYRIDDMIDQMVKPYIPKGMSLTIYEDVELQDKNLLYGTPLKNPAMEITNVITVSNKRWFLVWRVTDEFSGGPNILNAIFVGFGIFAVALFFSVVVEMMASRTRVVEKEVQTRTEELTRANQKLVELNDLKNKFLGMASHDLRNPLASIRGFSKYLLEKGKQVKEETRDEFLTTIKTVSGNMLELISNLLDISVIESGQLKLEPEITSMQKLVEEKIHLQQILADKKNISLHTEFGDVSEFSFDANRMGQVVDNLLSNAVKYSPPEKDVFVELSCKEDKVRFSVRDQGPGISHEERDKLFQHFQKLSAKPTGGESSSGLGLAIAQRIVEEHGGSIGVESEPGEGANFYFELPDVRKPV
jgi:signal transduction histidine kinase